MSRLPKVEDKPNTWICYWAAEYTKDFMKIIFLD